MSQDQEDKCIPSEMKNGETSEDNSATPVQTITSKHEIDVTETNLDDVDGNSGITKANSSSKHDVSTNPSKPEDATQNAGDPQNAKEGDSKEINNDITDGSPSKSGSEEGSPSRILSFRLFKKESYERQVEREKTEKERAIEKQAKAQEAHLKDGVLVFGDEEDQEEAPKPDPGLVEGNALLDSYGILPTDYIGKPIEEIDKVIIDKTFVVIAKKIKKKIIYRFSSTSSFNLLPPWNPLRKLAVRICTNQFFDYFVILTILTNCVFLTIPDLTFAETSEYIFLVIYFFEMMIKVIARGFIVDKYTYLRDAWNWLDFIVIVSAFTTILIEKISPDTSVGNVQVLRTFRVLRALKTVNIVPGLKTIVNALLRAFKMLVDVLMLTLFCLMVFALFGLQVYRGVLRQKCVAVFNATDSSESYDLFIKNETNWLKEDDNPVICGNTTGAGGCPTDYICLPDIGENPNNGYTNYDHFGWAMLNAFQLITLDFWEDNYDKVIRASGPWNVVFFVLVVFFGSFYLINLMLAVVALSYEEEAESAGKERERERAGERKKKPNPLYDVAIIAVANKRNQKSRDNKGLKLEVDKRRDSHWPRISSVNPKFSPVNPNKPMIKKPSKDSGFSENMKGTRKVIRHADSQDKLDSDMMSMSSGSETKGKPKDILRKILIKQDSAGNVSSSSVLLERKSTLGEGSMVSDYSQDTSGSVILRADELEDPEDMEYHGQVLDRNCFCCSTCWRCGYNPWVRFQGYIFRFVSDPLFDLFITLCIILNTVLMATEHHNMSTLTAETIRIANYVFTVVFTLEAILKITAFSKYYFKSGWNVFDLVIVVASLIDLGLEDIDGLSVFRTFRLLRVFKLAQSWPTMRLLISIIVNTFGALGNLTVILAIIIYIFAVSGLQLFNDKYQPSVFDPDPVPRWNFNDFFHSCMMIFRVLCGEWIEPLWDCMKAEDELCMLIFLPALVFGNFMVLNLFLALLLNAFATDSMNKHKESTKVEESRLKLAFLRIKNLCCSCLPKRNMVKPGIDERGTDGTETIPEVKEKLDDADEIKPVMNGDMKKIFNGEVKSNNNSKDINSAFETTSKRDKFASFETAVNGLNMTVDVEKGLKKGDGDIKQNDSKADVDVDGLALGDTAENVQEAKKINDCLPLCLSKRIQCMKTFDSTSFGKVWFRMREISVKVVDNKYFEAVVLLTIFASSITLAFEDVYLDERPELKQALNILNIIFCILFSIEMVLKWLAYGLHKYFTAFWTILDFFIVLISIASLIAESLGISNLTAFRSLRTLRALRPLRAVSRLQSMRIVVNALMLAIPAIANVLLVCLVFWLIFSIMGVQFFAGKFYKCLYPNGSRIDAAIVANRIQCENLSATLNYTWVNSNVNFDNALNGYLALFQVATFEGWMEVMVDAIDSTKVDQQPTFESNIYYYLYFVTFIIFGSFFTLNLIIGVIIDNFNVLKKKYDGSYLDMFLTPSQRNYYNTLKKLGNKKPQKTIKRPKTKFQAFFFDIATSNKFELCIIIIIFLNMITMAIEHYHQSQVITDVLKILNIVYSVIFILECVIKLVGMRWHYFRQFWNVFDFIIVILSIAGLVLDDLLSSVFVTPTLLRVVRVFRIGRVLRLIKAAKGIRKLLFALIISLPAIFNIGALLCLLMYIYAIIGMSSFGNIKLSAGLDDIVNFQTFANSFMLLFRVATSAGWNEVLEPMLIDVPDCDPDFKTLPNGTRVRETNGDCGTPWLAVIFMVSYIFIAYLVVINMYIAVILENFNQAHQQEEVGITEDDFDMFYVVWERYDPLATQFIKYDALSDFLADLEEPLGLPKPNEIAIVSFNLPISEGDKLHCLDILMALVKKHLGAVEENEESKKIQEKMEEKFEGVFPSRVQTQKKSTTMQRKKEDVAARTLQRCWRSFKTSRALKNITNLAMQQKTDIANQASISRANSIISLGRRLSNALSSFFTSSRPSSALSRVSLKSNTSHHSLQPISRKSKIANTLKVPSINTLYPSGSDYNAHQDDTDIEL